MSQGFFENATPSRGIYDRAEALMTELGMKTPSTRLLGGAIAAGIAVNVLKPGFAYENGRARPWALFDNEDSMVAPTYVPWWLFSVAVGTALAVFL